MCEDNYLLVTKGYEFRAQWTTIRLDPEKLSYEEIYTGVNEYTAVPDGMKQTRYGNYQTVYKYVDMYNTQWGQVTHGEWYNLACKVIKAKGDVGLFKEILKKVRAYGWSHLQNDEEQKVYAAKCLIEGAWQTWEACGEFTAPPKDEGNVDTKVMEITD